MKIKIIKGIETPVAKFFCSSPETDAFSLKRGMWNDEILAFCRKLERERDEAREALRQIWQSGDAFLPYIDEETTNRWRKAAGWEETQ